MLTPLVLFLGAAVSLAVLKSPVRPPSTVGAPERLTPTGALPLWNPAVPVAERFESVTVLDRERATKIVEVFGTRREVLFEVAS